MTLIARLRIILNDVEPMPMRHIEVPLKIRLDRLHEVIQAAMGWTDTHLYEFRVGDAGWGMPDPDGFYDGPMDAKKMTLEKLLDQTATRTIQYVYDFGDDWDHSIRIERVGEATQGVTYPRLLKAAGALSTGGRRRRLGLRRVPRSPRRSRSRAARGHGPLVGRGLRRRGCRGRHHHRTLRAAGEEMGPAASQTQNYDLSDASDRGLRRMVTIDWR